MVEWYHRLKGHEFEQALRDGKGQEAWHATIHGVTKSDMTEELHNNKKYLALTKIRFGQ